MLLYCVVTNLDIFSVYGLLFPCRSSEMNPGVAVEITQNDSTLVKDMWFLIAHTHLYKINSIISGGGNTYKEKKQCLVMQLNAYPQFSPLNTMQINESGACFKRCNSLEVTSVKHYTFILCFEKWSQVLLFYCLAVGFVHMLWEGLQMLSWDDSILKLILFRVEKQEGSAWIAQKVTMFTLSYVSQRNVIKDWAVTQRKTLQKRIKLLWHFVLCQITRTVT